MFEILASGLQAGDEFTVDNGATWLRVKRATLANRKRVVVVVDHEGKERIMGAEELVVVK